MKVETLFLRYTNAIGDEMTVAVKPFPARVGLNQAPETAILNEVKRILAIHSWALTGVRDIIAFEQITIAEYENYLENRIQQITALDGESYPAG